MTVTWRRSAASWGFAATISGCWAAGVVPLSSRIARRILRRSPRTTPIFSRSWSVSSGRTEKSMRFSAKRFAYSDRPSFSANQQHAALRQCLSIGLHSARAGNFIREARDAVGRIFQPGARGRRGAEGLRGTFQREFFLTASTRPAAHASDRAADTVKDLRAETTLAASHRPHPSAPPFGLS